MVDEHAGGIYLLGGDIRPGQVIASSASECVSLYLPQRRSIRFVMKNKRNLICHSQTTTKPKLW
jgi:hypothetical protein